MAEKSYRIRIVRAEQEFEVEGDKKFVVEMLDRFESGGSSVTSAGLGSKAGGGLGNSITAKSISAREFIQKLGLKKHTDYGLAFGYYIEKILGKEEFTPADINNCYYEAKMEPSNTSQVIINNTKRGRMMIAKKAKGSKTNRKTYVLTTTGEEFISSKLSGAPKR